MEIIDTRVTVEFYGRVKDSGIPTERHVDRRTIKIPKCFDMKKAKNEAAIALTEPDGPSPAYEAVSVVGLSFN